MAFVLALVFAVAPDFDFAVLPDLLAVEREDAAVDDRDFALEEDAVEEDPESRAEAELDACSGAVVPDPGPPAE